MLMPLIRSIEAGTDDCCRFRSHSRVRRSRVRPSVDLPRLLSSASAGCTAISAFRRIPDHGRSAGRYLRCLDSMLNMEEFMFRQGLRHSERRAVMLATGLLASVAASAAPDPTGRWQGVADIP